MAPHGLQSGYCALSGAKSTIALAFSTDGTYFASTHGDHTVKARRVASPAAGAPVHMLKPARARASRQVFDSSSWAIRAVLTGHERTPWTVKFHPRSRRILASGSLDQSLWMWMVPLGHDFMNGGKAAFHIERSVMYSDAGFDVSKCGRFLALCELDTATASGYHLKTVSLQPRSLGQVLQTVALPNCPYVTSVQFSPLVASVLIGCG
ncbi:hypothetical protein EMIHUDRAFT_203781 [Emiliania huxleyi CCMP1516]|uniref:Uncharacterized protein n=2 Tax=Emiliania huxleyi TaxID=2903 RepID=A0A0D3K0E2_EMIH1|nr:hypothetical protein EMIHUDRAFT_203781 [Emiliania huxleyi CCMP1516]EOD29227.1 hypothetical protein EMIHUDRAFT_203781 [Emiliania huxleyi CCMP1516]|eukprot:XP_005781656.1 hypothetical protein EMIHUDRAFT_203781 [Emiliania huxleyi CCMP1516]